MYRCYEEAKAVLPFKNSQRKYGLDFKSRYSARAIHKRIFRTIIYRGLPVKKGGWAKASLVKKNCGEYHKGKIKVLKSTRRVP